MKHAEQYPVPDGKLQGTVLGVVEVSSVLLHLEEASAYLVQELIPVGQHGVDGLRSCPLEHTAAGRAEDGRRPPETE